MQLTRKLSVLYGFLFTDIGLPIRFDKNAEFSSGILQFNSPM